jgi:hypothetical protein
MLQMMHSLLLPHGARALQPQQYSWLLSKLAELGRCSQPL